MRCTGILPYHTCPHHLRWRWFFSPRSGHASPWFCCTAGRSGLASGSGRLGSSCSSRCKTWNQQNSAGIPAQSCETGGNRVKQTDRQKMKKHRQKDRRWEIVTAQVLIVMCAVAFMGSVSKKIVLQGLKTEITTWKLWLWHFSVSPLAFNLQILYAPHLQAANYATWRVNEVPVWVKNLTEQVQKPIVQTLCFFVLRQQYTMCLRRYWETCTPFPQASKQAGH